MILAIFTWTAYVAACAIVTVILIGGAYLACVMVRDRQRAIGYGHGVRDGMKEGYRRGRTDVTLAQVLNVPATGGDFTEALLSGALREPVGEDMAALIGAVQEHERATRTEASR